MKIPPPWWQSLFRSKHPGESTEGKGHPHGQWFLLAGYCDATTLISPRPNLLQPLHPPDRVFWADPFAWSKNGRYFIFFEEYPYDAKRGRISVIELDSECRIVGKAQTAIEEPYHLSYPFLFEFEGELYMLPEKKTTRRLDLYRCVEFPNRWEFAKTLFKRVRMVDAGIFESKGLWWLFCAMKQRGLRYDETLFAFYADSPLSSQWHPHPQNPLVRDYSLGRPGGRIMTDDQGRLLRPSQDCVRRYGDGLNISEIIALSEDHYEERLIWRMTGEQAGDWLGMHHLDWHKGLLVMDAQRLSP